MAAHLTSTLFQMATKSQNIKCHFDGVSTFSVKRILCAVSILNATFVLSNGLTARWRPSEFRDG